MAPTAVLVRKKLEQEEEALEVVKVAAESQSQEGVAARRSCGEKRSPASALQHPPVSVVCTAPTACAARTRQRLMGHPACPRSHRPPPLSRQHRQAPLQAATWPQYPPNSQPHVSPFAWPWETPASSLWTSCDQQATLNSGR